MRGIRILLFAVLAVSICASGLNAGTVGPNCNNCFGATFTLSDPQLLSSDLNNHTDTYQISYTIDATDTAFQLSNGAVYINSLAFKVTENVISVSSPVTGPAGTGTWYAYANSTDTNNDCSTNGGGGFVCAQGGRAYITAGNTYTWIFNFTTDRPLTSTAVIKANWDPPNGLIVSETVAMPEGVVSELPLAAAGLLLCLGCQARKRMVRIP